MCCRENLTNHEHKTYELLIIVISYNKLTIVNFIAEQSQINNLTHQQVANPSQQQFYELHQNQKWMKVHHSVDTWSSSCSLLFPKSIKSSQNFKTIKRERENNLNSGKVGRAVLPTQFLRIHKSSAPRASSVEGAHATTTSTCPKSLANILNAVMACFAAVPLWYSRQKEFHKTKIFHYRQWHFYPTCRFIT